MQNTANTWLEEAVKACETLLGKYSLYKDGEETYWKMFTATDLSSNPEVILGRVYLENKVGHAAQRYFNQNNSNRQSMGATRGLIDEYLCIDGRPIYTGGMKAIMNKTRTSSDMENGQSWKTVIHV